MKARKVLVAMLSIAVFCFSFLGYKLNTASAATDAVEIDCSSLQHAAVSSYTNLRADNYGNYPGGYYFLRNTADPAELVINTDSFSEGSIGSFAIDIIFFHYGYPIIGAFEWAQSQSLGKTTIYVSQNANGPWTSVSFSYTPTWNGDVAGGLPTFPLRTRRTC